MYIPTMTRLSGQELKDNTLSGPFTVATVSAALRERIEEGAQKDRDGKAALAAVVTICQDPRFAGRGLTSCCKRVLAALGDGWTAPRAVGGDVNLRCPKGQTVYLRGSMLDLASVLDTNTCHTVGADGRLAASVDALALVPEIARAMVGLANAQADLYEKLHGNPYIEFCPWYMVAAHLKAGG